MNNDYYLSLIPVIGERRDKTIPLTSEKEERD